MKEIGNKKTVINYTYSVTWEEVYSITTRWDHYMNSDPRHSNIYWISILNSLVCTLLFIVITGLMLLRTLRRDINIYNRAEPELSDNNEGWKLMHGDVFRPPSLSMWLGPLLGSGIQFLNMSFFTLALGLLGLLNPSYRGGLISYGVSLYFLSG